jgi:hypothetical protein
MLAVQDTVIGVVLDWSAKAPKLMKRLERLDYAGLLSERQKERFVNAIHARPLAELQIGGLSLPYYTDKILSGLKSYTWPTQNPAAELLWNCGPSQIAQLHPETQELLGRNILQAADGSSNGAIDFLVNVTRSTDVWSTPFVSGIVTECFTNNENQYRFKRSQLGNAMLSLKRIPSSDRCRIVEAIIAGIRAAQPNGYNSGIAERDEVCTTLDGLSYDADIGSSAQELARFLRSLSGETT